MKSLQMGKINGNVLTLTFIVGLVLLGCQGQGLQEDEQPLLIVSWGGQFQQDLVEHWLDKAAEKCKINIEPQSWNGNYGALSSQIEKGINIWDLVHVEDHYVANPKSDTLFQSHPEMELEALAPAFIRPQAVPVLEYSYVLTYRQDLLGAQPLNSWVDFWDTDQWEGSRGLRDFPVGNIEAALLSLGEDPRQVLYDNTLDRDEVRQSVGRALDRIEELGEIVWWETGDELQRNLANGATPISAAWSGRVWAVHQNLCSEVDVEECPIKTVKTGSMAATDWWIIPKNSGNGAKAARFLECLYLEALRPAAKQFALEQGYAVPLVGVDYKDPIANHYLGLTKSAEAIDLNDEFWGRNFTWINDQWLARRASGAF